MRLLRMAENSALESLLGVDTTSPPKPIVDALEAPHAPMHAEFVTPHTLQQNPEKHFHILDDREAKRLLMQLGMFGVFRAEVPERSGNLSLQCSNQCSNIARLLRRHCEVIRLSSCLLYPESI